MVSGDRDRAADRAGRPAPDTIDHVDRQILEVLAADGRTSVATLAERVGISRAGAYSRLERLRADGVILERLQALDMVRATQTIFVLEEVVRRPYVLP